MKRSLKLRWILAPALGALLVGCGESGPVLVPVSGVVTLNGKPLADADISFVPDPSNKDVIAGGDRTGPEGNYKAMSNNRSGLAPGRYKVLISKKAELPAGVKVPQEISVDRIQQEMSGLRKESLPAKYSDATKSEFVAEVVPGGAPMDFDVKASATKSGTKTASSSR